MKPISANTCLKKGLLHRNTQRLVSIIILLLLQSFLIFSSGAQSLGADLADPLAERIMMGIEQGFKYTDASLILMTRNLKWYEKNMHRLPENIAQRVEMVRVQLAAEAASTAAREMGEADAVFGATGSWNPGRDIDIIYFGKNTAGAKKHVADAYERATANLLAAHAESDDILKYIKNEVPIPKSLSSETMSIVVSDLPNFGYKDLEKAWLNAKEAVARGESRQNIMQQFYEQVRESLANNFEAHIATTAPDMYRGAEGQEWYKKTYLENPDKMRTFSIDPATGQRVLKKGGINAVPQEIAERLGFGAFKGGRLKFSSVASNLSLFFTHEKGGLSDTSKYAVRIWNELDFSILEDISVEDMKPVCVAELIANSPDNAARILADAGMTEDGLRQGLTKMLYNWTEKQLLIDTEKLVNELASHRLTAASTATADQIDDIIAKMRLKFDLNELASGLQALNVMPEEMRNQLISVIRKKFGGTEAGDFAVKYIMKQMKLLGDEGGEITKTILKMLKQMGQATDEEVEAALKSLAKNEEIPGNIGKKVRTARKEVMVLSCASMLDFDADPKALDRLMEDWRKYRSGALIQSPSKELQIMINQAKQLPQNELVRLGWNPVEARMVELRNKLPGNGSPETMKQLEYKLGGKLGKARITLSQFQSKLRELLFNPAYTQLGDDTMTVGVIDAFIGAAVGLYQTYDILFNRNLSAEDENLELGNAWVTALPIVGDFAQGLITGGQAWYEGDKGKALEAGLWISIGIMGCVPGGQLPALIAGISLATKPLAVGAYDARQAQNLIQAWVESGKWTDGKPAKLEGLIDREKNLHMINYEDLLTDKGNVYYNSDRIKSLFFKEVTINDSIRAYAEQYIFPQYPPIAAFRDALKTLYPDFNDKEWDDEFTAGIKIDVRGGKGGKVLFKVYDTVRKQALGHTLSHLKTWAEDEHRAAKDYSSEVARLQEELRTLEGETRTNTLVKHAEDSAEAYSRIVKNWWEQESLSLSKLRIYEQYVKTYRTIAGQLRRINDLFREASSQYIPSDWHLTGYPVFDTVRMNALVTNMEQGRRGVIQNIEKLLRELNQQITSFNPDDECQMKAFKVIAPLRYKVVFIENLIMYYNQLAEGSGAWGSSYEAAKKQYEQLRDEAAKSYKGSLVTIMEGKAMYDAFNTFIFSMPYYLASGEVGLYQSTAESYESKKIAAAKEYELATWTSGAGGKALQECLRMGLKIEIQVSNPNPETGEIVEAIVKLKEGSLPKDTSWAWETKGGLTVKPRFGEQTTVKVESEGELIVRLMDERYIDKSITETRVKIIPKAYQLNLVLQGPTEAEAGRQIIFSVVSSSDGPLPKDIQYEWIIDGQSAGYGRQVARSFQHARFVDILVNAYHVVDGKKIKLGSARQTLVVSDAKPERDELAERKKERERIERERVQREKEEMERLEREKRLKTPPVCKYQYSEWGECERATRKKTRNVISSYPVGCSEKDRPILEQDCTPPLTEAERRKNLLDCICYESHGTCSLPYRAQEGRYHPEPVGCNPLTPPEHCKAGPPCLGCTHRGFMNVSGKAIEACFEASGIEYNSKEIEELKAINRKYMSPLKVTLSPEGKPLKPKYGEILKITANIEGGVPEYKISWSGQGEGRGNTFTFIDTRKPGTYNVSVSVSDSYGNSRTASTTILIEDIKITITGLKDTVFYSQSLAVSANVTGAATTVKQGEQPAKEQEKVSQTSSQTGKTECTPGAECRWICSTRGCRCVCPPEIWKQEGYHCDPKNKKGICKYHGEICGKCPEKNEAKPVQDTAKKETKTEEIGSISVLWQSSPNLSFSPQQGTSTNVTFDRMGKVKIWAVAQRETGKGVYETVGESEQREVNVIAPKFKISLKPEKGGVGQEVRAAISSDPSIPANMVNYVWITPTSKMPYEKNESVIGFTPRDTKTIELKASARVPTVGETISDDIQATFTAQQYTVKATVIGIPETRRPKIWKPGVGLVTLDSSTYAADEHVRLRSDIEGYPNTSEVRWNWTANEGTTIISPTSREPAAYRHETGTATLTVVAKDKEGIELGRSMASFTVTVSQEMIKDSQKKAEAADKLAKAKALVHQGKLDEGITLSEEAMKLDAKNTEAHTLAAKWKTERNSVKTHTDATKKLINESKLTDAEKELNEAKRLHPKYPPVIEAEKALNEAKKRADNLKKAVEEKISQAKNLVSQGKLDEGINLVDEALRLDTKSTDAQKLSKQWKADKELVSKQLDKTSRLMAESKFADAQKELIIAKNLHGRYKPVIDLDQKLTNDWSKYNDTVRDRFYVIDAASQRKEYRKSIELIKSMKSSMKLDALNEKELKRREDWAIQHITNHEGLVKQGADLERQNKLKEALDKYVAAKNIMPDQAVELRIKDIQAKLASEQQKAQRATQARSEGEAYQKQNKIPEAIAKYKEYMKYAPNDTAMTKHIAELEKKVAADQQKAQYAMQLRTQGETLQKQNKVPEAIAKYKEYMTYMSNDTAMAKHIAELEKKIAADQQKAQYAMQLRTQGETLQKQNKIPEAIAKYKEYMQYAPNDTAMAKHIKTLEATVVYSVDTGRTGRSYTARPIERQPQAQISSAWSGLWRSEPGVEKEVLSFSITTKGNIIAGNWSVSIPYKTSSGVQKTTTLTGPFEGNISGSRATGTFHEESDKSHKGTFDCTIAANSIQLTCTFRADTGESRTYTLKKTSSP